VEELELDSRYFVELQSSILRYVISAINRPAWSRPGRDSRVAGNPNVTRQGVTNSNTESAVLQSHHANRMSSVRACVRLSVRLWRW